jgi:hypothetical protein
MAILNNSNAISSGGYDINNSLRFRSSATAYLNRTLTTPTNNKIWTWSGWVKIGALSSFGTLFGSASPSTGFTSIRVSSDNTLAIFQFDGAAYDYYFGTSQVFRDPSAWYHIVIAMDTTQATNTNRMKLYVNGNQVTAFSSSPVPVSYPTQNLNTNINSAVVHRVGAGNYVGAVEQTFDGYMTDVYFIDGSQKAASDFGETDTTTGVWKPKAYTGTYGTNGFYLKFSDIATTSGSNAGLGKDFSGNANYWTTNNISVTAGTTYDAMIDSPTLTSATVANYCVLNPLQKSSNVTLSNANLTWSTSGASTKVLSTIGMSSGKYYCEFTLASGNGNYGIATAQTGISGTNYLGNDTNSWCYAIDGNKYTNGSGAAYGATYTSGDIIGVAFDADAGTLTYYKNGSSQGTAFTGLTNGPYFFAQGADPSAGSVNFGQRPFSYTPPTGFVRLNTYNLPDSTIKKGNTVMDATLWTGNATTNVIVNQSQFRPDFAWIKGRGNAENHALFDSVRGANKNLASNTTGAEGTQTDMLMSFNSNGFTLGADGNWQVNKNATTYVGWQWQAGQGSTSSNTSGSITSTVSVNATAGFSVVTYTGTGANATVGHGLGVAPKMVIVKNRTTSGDEWCVWHTSLTNATYYLYLNGTAAQAVDTTFWNSTAPSSTVISLGSNGRTNRSSSNMVCYAWAEIAGFSKFGSYTGNGNADGPFIYTGFRPRFILYKNSSSGTAFWRIWDTARAPYNADNNALYPNSSSAEDLGSGPIDELSNGFKIRTSSANDNGNGNTFIYAAFAENPFKNSLAR